jgi:hypothetical protein
MRAKLLGEGSVRRPIFEGAPDALGSPSSPDARGFSGLSSGFADDVELPHRRPPVRLFGRDAAVDGPGRRLEQGQQEGRGPGGGDRRAFTAGHAPSSLTPSSSSESLYPAHAGLARDGLRADGTLYVVRDADRDAVEADGAADGTDGLLSDGLLARQAPDAPQGRASRPDGGDGRRVGGAFRNPVQSMPRLPAENPFRSPTEVL